MDEGTGGSAQCRSRRSHPTTAGCPPNRLPHQQAGEPSVPQQGKGCLTDSPPQTRQGLRGQGRRNACGFLRRGVQAAATATAIFAAATGLAPSVGPWCRLRQTHGPYRAYLAGRRQDVLQATDYLSPWFAAFRGLWLHFQVQVEDVLPPGAVSCSFDPRQPDFSGVLENPPLLEDGPNIKLFALQWPAPPCESKNVGQRSHRSQPSCRSLMDNQVAEGKSSGGDSQESCRSVLSLGPCSFRDGRCPFEALSSCTYSRVRAESQAVQCTEVATQVQEYVDSPSTALALCSFPTKAPKTGKANQERKVRFDPAVQFWFPQFVTAAPSEVEHAFPPAPADPTELHCSSSCPPALSATSHLGEWQSPWTFGPRVPAFMQPHAGVDIQVQPFAAPTAVEHNPLLPSALSAVGPCLTPACTALTTKEHRVRSSHCG